MREVVVDGVRIDAEKLTALGWSPPVEKKKPKRLEATFAGVSFNFVSTSSDVPDHWICFVDITCVGRPSNRFNFTKNEVACISKHFARAADEMF